MFRAGLAALISLISMVLVFVPAANAQVPKVGVYFDRGFAKRYYDSCAPGKVDSAFVVARDFNMMVLAVAFAVEYPPGVQWIADIAAPGVVSDLGDSPVDGPSRGTSLAWPYPQNGYEPVHVVTIIFQCLYDCLDMPDEPVRVVGHPDITPGIQAIRYPDFGAVPGFGATSWFCPYRVPRWKSSWGDIKALYE